MKKNKDKNNYKDYNETLSVLPYEQLVRKLCGKEKHLVITFSEYYDQFGTKKTYHDVTVRYIGKDKVETYLAADQDSESIEQNLITALGRAPKDKKVNYGYIDNDMVCQFHAYIGNNLVIFPPSVTRRLISSIKESTKNQQEFEKAKQELLKEEPKRKILYKSDSDDIFFDI